MSDSSEPKWERVEPPNFDEDDVPKSDSVKNLRFELDETPASPEAIKTEAAHLYSMGQLLGVLVSDMPPMKVTRGKGYAEDVLFNLHEHTSSDFHVESNQEPFSGIGDGRVRFMHYNKPIPFSEAGFPVKAFLEVGVHTLDKSMKEARVYSSQHPELIHFYKTMIYLDGEDKLKITSKIPKGLLDHKPHHARTPQGELPAGFFRHDTEEVSSPITVGKLEFAGAALSALINRTQFYKENPPPSKTNKPPIL